MSFSAGSAAFLAGVSFVAGVVIASIVVAIAWWAFKKVMSLVKLVVTFVVSLILASGILLAVLMVLARSGAI